jgi:hypothetical protein
MQLAEKQEREINFHDENGKEIDDD